MQEVDFLIIGGSAAGTTAAEIIRSQKPEASIVIVTDENHEEYSRVLLPNYFERRLVREQLFLKTPQWYAGKNIDLLKGKKAMGLDIAGHIVKLSDGSEYKYQKLLLAIGGDVIRLGADGEDLENIFYFRTLEDTERIMEAAAGSKKAIIVGGGFVSLDFATGFKANNVSEITILVRESYYWETKIDRDSSRLIEAILNKNGVKIITGEEVDHYEEVPNSKYQAPNNKKVGGIVTKSGKRFLCDVVGIGVGIRTDLEWLKAAGIKTNRGILTNEYLETSAPDIWAAGDCAEFHDVIFERQHIMGNWANGTTQGAAAGKGMAGQRTVYATASSYSDTFFEGSYTFIGVTDENFADEVVTRGSFEDGKMTRIFIKTIDGVLRIIGASAINNSAEVPSLTRAIKEKVPVSTYESKFSDISFNLAEIFN